MAVRLRPQSSAWMAPHALAAQLTAQTGQIAASGPQALLAGLSQGVGAFTQARNRRQEMAINESRYQDSLGFRQEEMALRKQQSDMDIAQGQASILGQGVEGSDTEIAMFVANNPGAPIPPEMVQRNKQLKESLRAIYTRFGGVPSSQTVAERSAPAAGTIVNGKSMSQMTDAELNDVMAKSERGDVDVTYRGGATRDMGQGVGEQPAAAPSTPAAPESAAVEVPSSGDPLADRFLASMREQKRAIVALEAEAAKFERIKNGTQQARYSKLKSAIDEGNTKLLEAQGRYQVYLADRTKKMADATKAAEEERKAAKDAAELAAINERRKANGQPPLASLREVAPQMTTERVVEGREDAQAHALKMQEQRHADSLARIKFSNEEKQRGRLEIEGIRKQAKDEAAAVAAVRAAVSDQKNAMDSYLASWKALKEQAAKGGVGEDDPDLRDAWSLYSAARSKYMGMIDGAGEMAPEPAAPAAAEPVDRESARAIFDREVKARGIDPTSDAARQLAADIKAGKVR